MYVQHMQLIHVDACRKEVLPATSIENMNLKTNDNRVRVLTPIIDNIENINV